MSNTSVYRKSEIVEPSSKLSFDEAAELIKGFEWNFKGKDADKEIGSYGASLEFSAARSTFVLKQMAADCNSVLQRCDERYFLAVETLSDGNILFLRRKRRFWFSKTIGCKLYKSLPDMHYQAFQWSVGSRCSNTKLWEDIRFVEEFRKTVLTNVLATIKFDCGALFRG